MFPSEKVEEEGQTLPSTDPEADSESGTSQEEEERQEKEDAVSDAHGRNGPEEEEKQFFAPLPSLSSTTSRFGVGTESVRSLEEGEFLLRKGPSTSSRWAIISFPFALLHPSLFAST